MRWIFLLLLIPVFSFGQKWIGADSFHEIDLKEALIVESKAVLSDDTASVKDYLLSTIPNLKGEKAGLVLTSSRISPKANHFHFAQTFNGHRVFQDL